jgi:hypothetical protein
MVAVEELTVYISGDGFYELCEGCCRALASFLARALGYHAGNHYRGASLQQVLHDILIIAIH